MTTVLMNDLLGSAERSAIWERLGTFFSATQRNDTPNMLHRTTAVEQSATAATEYQLELRELAGAAERESVLRMADAKSLQLAGMERMKQAEALQSQADYYSQLIR